MAATSSESVETMTDENTPLSMAGAIVYANAGCPARARMFLPGTRLEPSRAGMNATAEVDILAIVSEPLARDPWDSHQSSQRLDQSAAAFSAAIRSTCPTAWPHARGAHIAPATVVVTRLTIDTRRLARTAALASMARAPNTTAAAT
jgi:hypothetical protein